MTDVFTAVSTVDVVARRCRFFNKFEAIDSRGVRCLPAASCHAASRATPPSVSQSATPAPSIYPSVANYTGTVLRSRGPLLPQPARPDAGRRRQLSRAPTGLECGSVIARM